MATLKEQRRTLRSPPWTSSEIRHQMNRVSQRPRFPLEWLNEIPDHSPPRESAGSIPGIVLDQAMRLEQVHVPRPEQHRGVPIHFAIWGLLIVMAFGLGFAIHALWDASWVSSPALGVRSHTFWVEGTVAGMGNTAHGVSTLTVVGVTGRPSTVEVDPQHTSVFQQGVTLNMAHLKIGQQVVLRYARGVAQSIEIVRQPILALPPH